MKMQDADPFVSILDLGLEMLWSLSSAYPYSRLYREEKGEHAQRRNGANEQIEHELQTLAVSY